MRARRTCNPNNAIKDRSNNIGGINHSVELSGVNHISGETRDRGVARELRTNNCKE
jgi:hypothetical protein